MRILIKEKLSEHKSKTPEGYLICQDAILARTGDQGYLKSELYEDFDGEDSMIQVQRKPEQVFAAEALSSFEDKPITIEHPDENVGPDNYSDLAVGHTRNVRKGKFNGQDVMIADLVITDAQAIEEIENGIRTELSCGYDCDITEGDHPEQINIRGNHIALCKEGRAGIAKIIDSKPEIKDIKPHKGEKKADFLSRFMKETKAEYPDEKQRIAVAYSYWNRKDDSMPYLPTKEKNKLKKYLSSISKFTGKDIDITDIIDPIKSMGYEVIRENIDGWNKRGDGMLRKDYTFSFKDYADQIMVSLYANPDTFDVTEVNAYFLLKKKNEDSKPAWTVMYAWEMEDGDPYTGTAVAYAESEDEAKEIVKSYHPKIESFISVKKGALVNSFDYPYYYHKNIEEDDVEFEDANVDDVRIEDKVFSIEFNNGGRRVREDYPSAEQADKRYDELIELQKKPSMRGIDPKKIYPENDSLWVVHFKNKDEDGKEFDDFAIVFAKTYKEAMEIVLSYEPEAIEFKPSLAFPENYDPENDNKTFYQKKPVKDEEEFDAEELVRCAWCDEEYPAGEMKKEQKIGYLCPYCIQAIRSRGEKLVIEDTEDKEINLKEFISAELSPEYTEESGGTIVARFTAEADAERAIENSSIKDLPYNVIDDESAYYVMYMKDDIKDFINENKLLCDSSDGKFVLYMKDGIIYVTSFENYNAEHCDMRDVHPIFWTKSFEKAIEYLMTFGHIDREDIITIGDPDNKADVKDAAYRPAFYKAGIKEFEKKLKKLVKGDDNVRDENELEYAHQKRRIYEAIKEQIAKYKENLKESETKIADSDDTFDTFVKRWYCKTFPSDDVGETLNENTTFGDIFDCLDRHENIYLALGGDADSVVRERVFNKLAELIGTDYEYVYNQWLRSNG